MIALPLDCDVSIDVSPADSVVFSGTPVYPAPRIVTKYTDCGWEYLDEEFYIDEEAYQDSLCYPTVIASVDSLGSLRGQGAFCANMDETPDVG